MRRSDSRFATSVGAWINLALLVWFAARQNLITIDRGLQQSAVKLAAAGGALAIALYFCEQPITRLFAQAPLRNELTLLVLGGVGVVVYGGLVAVLFGPQWFRSLRARSRTTTIAPRDDATL